MPGAKPELSLVMPCYNEQEALPLTARDQLDTFARAGVRPSLVLVDHGSTADTGAIIDALVADGQPVKKVAHTHNQGYGGGILSGLRACDADVIGYLCADGQVAAEDTLMAYRLILGREDRILAKVRRRFRQDSFKRKAISITYNGLMKGLYGGLGAIDVNGSPKLFSREVFERMRLASEDWFLDPELIVKAHYLGLRIIEIDVEGYARQGGASNVGLGTCVEFVGNIGRYRFGDALARWRDEVVPMADPTASPAPPEPPAEPVGEQGPLPGVRVVTQRRHEDTRGSLHKVLQASQAHRALGQGEVYVTTARGGEVKGEHLHHRMGEWFSVVPGQRQAAAGRPGDGADRRGGDAGVAAQDGVRATGPGPRPGQHGKTCADVCGLGRGRARSGGRPSPCVHWMKATATSGSWSSARPGSWADTCCGRCTRWAPRSPAWTGPGARATWSAWT